MRRTEFTDVHYNWLCDRLLENDKTEGVLGEEFKREFPGVVPNSNQGRSVIVHLKRRAREAGYPMPNVGPGIKPSNTTWVDETPELIVPFQPSVLVLSDMHCPYHEVAVIEQALDVVATQGIKTVVWNGDTFDNEYKGHKGSRNWWAPPQQEGIEAAISVIEALTTAGIETHIWLQGNHDDKPMRDTDGEFTFTDFLDTKVRPHISPPSKWYQTNRYYCVMEPQKSKAWPFDGPKNFPWRFTHQKNYGKNPLAVARDLATIYLSNIVTGHQHHLGQTTASNGLLFAVDAGTCQRSDLPSYKNARDSRHPKWARGFVTIIGGRPQVHHAMG